MSPSNPQRLILLHTNDLHGRIEGLSRIATIIARIEVGSPESSVLYFDLGDSEETSNRLSNLTKGLAMHRLLNQAGCKAVAVGNAAIARYGPQILHEQSLASSYPHLLANLRTHDGSLIPGTRASTMIQVGDLRLGLVGLTAEFDAYQRFFGLQMEEAIPTVIETIKGLRDRGADVVVLLSHMGLPADRELAAAFQDEIPLILSAHTHDLLPTGEKVGNVIIAQAGHYAEHLGRIDLTWDGARLHVQEVSVLPVPKDIPKDPRLEREIEAIEVEVEAYLDEQIGELTQPLDFAEERECGVGNLMADALRERLRTDVGLTIVGQAFTGPLPGGILRRLDLWDACPSPANPGIVTMTGIQLIATIAKGLNPVLASERPHALRGRARGLMHISGASIREGKLFLGSDVIDPGGSFRVAASDFELEPIWGYTEEEWGLHPDYEVPTILREALEDYFQAYRPMQVTMERILGLLK